MSDISEFNDGTADSTTGLNDQLCMYDSELKCNTAGYLTGQAVLDNRNMVICDPHINIDRQDEQEHPGTRNGDMMLIKEQGIRESDPQTQNKSETRSSLSQRPRPLNGNGKRSKGQTNKVSKPANASTSRIQPLATPQTPVWPLMSALFPTSFAPPAIFTPANENGHRDMNGNIEVPHKIREHGLSQALVSEHTVQAKDDSQDNQEISTKVPRKTQRQAKRRKQAEGLQDKVSAMETLADSSTLFSPVYYPTKHDLFHKVDPYNYQLLQGYSNYSMFPQTPNTYSWMVHQNAAHQSSDITKKKSGFEAQNIPHIKTSPILTQHKLISEASCGKIKEEATNRDKSAELKEEIECTDSIKSNPCFPITKRSNESPAESSSSHLLSFNTSSESMFGKTKVSPHELFNGKDDLRENNFHGRVPKRKKLLVDENAVSETCNPHSNKHHKLPSLIPSLPHSLKPTPESPATVSTLPSPVTPINTTPSWQIAPNGLETALTPNLALGNQQHPFGLLQPNIYNVNTTGQVTAQEDVFYCHMCDYSGISKPEFEAHMNTHFEYNCSHCDYTSRTKGRLKRHIKDFHTDNGTKQHLADRSKTFKCKSCTFSTTEKEAFWKHYRTHIKEDKLLQCPYCSFITGYKHHLEYHISNHTGSKPFKCNKCNYSCVNRSMLNSHMKSHTKIYPYRCSDCTYASKYHHSLKLHLKKHNHKQARALNLNGSFPKEAVSENRLSIGDNSQNFTEQSYLRNDAVIPYFSQMFGMPDMSLGMSFMTPALNNISFWPMQHPTSMHAGVLADSLMFNQLMDAGAVNKVACQIESKTRYTNKNEKEEIDSKMDSDNLICTICNLRFKNPEALYYHILQMHGDTRRERAEYSKINTERSRDTLSRSSINQDFKNCQLKDPLIAHDDQDKLHLKNSCSDKFPRINSDHQYHQRALKAESGNNSTISVPSSLYPDKSSCRNKPEDIQNITISGHMNESTRDPNRAYKRQQIMHANCELETASKTISPVEQTVKDEKGNIKTEVEDFKNNFDSQCRLSALDLTKQKSLIDFNNLEFPMKGEDANISDHDEHSEDEDKCQKQTAALLYQLNTISDVENIVGNCQTTAEEITVPRKRSRKGTAYRLDLTRMKRQKIEANSFCDEAEFAFDKDRILKPLDRNEISDETTKELQFHKPKVMSHQKHEKMMHESDMKSNTEIIQKTNLKKDIEIGDNNTNVENVGKSEMDNLIFDEAELELQKLQRHLAIQSEQLDFKMSENCQAKDVDESTNDKFRVADCAQETAAEQYVGNNSLVLKNAQLTDLSEKFTGHFNHAEIRSSVTEETGKTVCSPLKKMDHILRMMTEEVIPLSSELPAVSSHSQTGMSSTVLPGYMPDLSTRETHLPAICNQIKSSDGLPDFSHSHLFNSSQSSSSHGGSFDEIMKPSTPKAYIHPNNRTTHELNRAIPTSLNKHNEQKLYECVHCQLSFGDCVMYTVHMGYHSKKNPFQCNNCGVVSQDRVAFFLHMVQSSHV